VGEKSEQGREREGVGESSERRRERRGERELMREGAEWQGREGEGRSRITNSINGRGKARSRRLRRLDRIEIGSAGEIFLSLPIQCETTAPVSFPPLPFILPSISSAPRDICVEENNTRTNKERSLVPRLVSRG